MPVGHPTITVEKRKWSGLVSARWEAELLADRDDVLVWRTPAGTTRARPARGRFELVTRTEISVAGPEWWVATAYLGDDGEPDEWKIDAATPAELDGEGCVRFTDLDLDVLVDEDAPLGRVVDQAVFQRRAARFGYPDDVYRGAEGGIVATLRRLRHGDWPFGGRLAGDLAVSLPKSA